MLFEQPASLNRFIPDFEPTWERRWKFIRIILPVIGCYAILLAESTGLKLWRANQLTLPHMAMILIVPIVFFIGLLGLNEFGMHNAARRRRRLTVLENGINFSGSVRPLILWPKIVGFWIEDISGETQLARVTVEYFARHKSNFPRRVSLVLNKRTQVQALISELTQWQLKGDFNFRIESRLPLPPPRQTRNVVAGLSLSLAGMLFVVNGLPLLMAGLQGKRVQTNDSEAQITWAPGQEEKLHKFIAAHFSSRAEYKHFLLATGSLLTITGVSLWICGSVIQKPATKSTAGNG